MHTESGVRKNPEVRVVLEKAAKYSMTPRFDISEGFVDLVLVGESHKTFEAEGRGWAPHAYLKRTNVKGEVMFRWEMGYFDPPKKEMTKVEGTLADENVMKLIPRSQIDTRALLVDVCASLRDGIEKAYPNTKLSGTGPGKGKRKLLFDVLDTLLAEGRISRNVVGGASIVVKNLIPHFRVEEGHAWGFDESPVTARAGTT